MGVGDFVGSGILLNNQKHRTRPSGKFINGYILSIFTVHNCSISPLILAKFHVCPINEVAIKSS